MVQKKLALRSEFLPQVAFQQIETLASKLVQSKALPSSIQNGAQLTMVLLAGYEAGMTPMQSINSYYIVNGKVTIWGSAVLVQLNQAGWEVEWLASDEKIATVKISKGRRSHTESFTIEEATAAGLTGKDTWKKYARNMLRWKALGNGVRFFCPEVLQGYYLKEEIDDVEARTVDVEPTTNVTVEPPPVQQEKKQLDEKLNKAIHAGWRELAEVYGWDTETTNGKRKATLMAVYKVDSNNDLEPEQAVEFIERTKKAVEKAKASVPNAAGADGSKPPVPSAEGTDGSEEKPKKTTKKKKEPETIDVAAQNVAQAFGGKVVEKCPLCKTEYEDDGKETGDAGAIRFAGACNACMSREDN